MRAMLLGLVAGTLLSGHALAWGPEGHQIVASIAENDLSAPVRAQVKQLLAGGADSLADIASWADQVRPSRPDTAAWHFADIPADADGYDPQRDCKRDSCVVAQITLKAKVLSDKAQSPARRFEALIWVVHFVGDIHQPLHCINNDDRGGNDVKVKFNGHTVKLHQVWDSGIIDSADDDHGDFATRLFKAITPAERSQWLSTRDPADWADECFSVAKQQIYQPLGPVDKPCPDADASEQDESDEAGGELVISGGDAPLLLEVPNEALNP
jgi:hypothetical protein